MDKDRDGRIDVVTHYQGGKVVRQEEDKNGDGRMDLWSYFIGGRLDKQEKDSNGDGKVDQWFFLNQSGQLERHWEDRNFDQKVDFWVTYRGGRKVKEEVDTDNDGKPDIIEHYDAAGIVVKHQGEEFREEITLPLDSVDPRFKDYLEVLRDRILEVWDYPDGAEPGLRGKVKLKFSIERDGSVSQVKVLKSSGYRVLDKGALEAIRRGSPFLPLPPEFKTNRLIIKGGFRYN
jgi:TonB family protein